MSSATAATDNLILSGQFTGTLNFGGGVALTSFGGSDQFIAKMSPDGNVLWAENFGSTSEDGGNEVTVVTDLSGSIISSAISMGNYRAGDFTFTNHGNRDSYIQKLSSTATSSGSKARPGPDMNRSGPSAPIHRARSMAGTSSGDASASRESRTMRGCWRWTARW